MRTRAISYVAVLLVMCVVAMYMIVISVLEGFKNHYMDKIQSVMAHVTTDVGNLSWGIEQPEKWSQEIATADPDIRAVTIGLETPAMAIFNDWRTIGPLRGIDLDQELKHGRLGEILSPPELKNAAGFGVHEYKNRQLNGCIVGGAWRKQYNLKVGDRLVSLFSDDEDEAKTVTFYIIGFFEGNNPYLEQGAYVDRKLLAEKAGQA